MVSKKAPKGSLKRLLKYVYDIHGKKLFVVLVLMVLATLTNIAATYTIQNVIAEAALMVENNSTDFSAVIRLVSLMVGLYLTSIALTYTYLRLMINIGQDTMVNLRNSLFNKVMKLPLKYFDTNKHGDVMSRFTNDVDATRQMISQSLPQLIISSLTIVGYITAMIITSWILAIVTISVTIILFFAMSRISMNSRKYFINQQKSLGAVNGFIEEMIEGQKVVKVFRYEKRALKHFTDINEDLYQNARSASIRTGMLIPITVNVGYLSFAIVATLGAYLISQNLLTIAALVGFLLFTRNLTGPSNQISQQVNYINVALSGASRVFDVLNEKEEVDDGKVVLTNAEYQNGKLVSTNKETNLWAWKTSDSDELVKLSGDVRFDHVIFGYNDDKVILKDISLYAKPGQKIAFVGATGAGKTTITNLINRFYDIQDGAITYDGINVKDIKKDSLRKSLGIVLQDTNLFTDTVMENIRYGKLDATDEEVIAAAKLANADDFIQKLHDGYNTVLSDNGTNLSQGQRQLLSIARAAVANPPVLILDEATSSIDTHTEKLVQDGMDMIMKGRTVFVIAHRLSTIKNAEAIIVLENGEIIERGNHATLLESRGKYYQLYTGAFELE